MEIRFTSFSSKFLKKCDSEIRSRLLEKIKKLLEEPFPHDCKRVWGRKEKVFRVRVGDYRILYFVSLEKDSIVIQDIGKRGNIYN